MRKRVLFQPGDENHRLALPHKLFDCMLAGLPVIAPAFAEEVAAVVRDAACGVLVDSADPGAIAAAVTGLGAPARRAAMGEPGDAQRSAGSPGPARRRGWYRFTEGSRRSEARGSRRSGTARCPRITPRQAAAAGTAATTAAGPFAPAVL